MNRTAKKHRSTKVPNVKLRPAAAGSSAVNEKRRQEAEAEREDLAHYRRLRDRQRAGKENDDSDDDDDHNTAKDDGEDDDKFPLLGCVICMTGITEEKAKLVEYTKTLGGKISGNLTEDTTHLIAEGPGSEKYHCAVRLGLPILRPEWLKELRARWTGAIAYDFDGLIEEHRLDIFEKVVAALAGMTESSVRTEVRRKLKSGSALTPTTFVLDNTFTHLICDDIKDSQTMKAVDRFRGKASRFFRRGEEIPEEGPYALEMRASMKLQAVWMEWVDDCMEVQGCIEERYYSINEPRMTIAQRRSLVESIKEERAKQEEKRRFRREAALLSNEDNNDAKRALTQVKETPSNGKVEVQRVTKKPKIDIGQYVQKLAKMDAEGASHQDDKQRSDRNEKENHFLQALTKAKSFTEDSQTLQQVKKSSVDQHLSPSTDIIEIKENVSLDERGENVDMQLEEEPAAGLQSDIREKSLASLSFRLDLQDDIGNNAIRKALEEQGVADILEPEDERMAHFHILPLGKMATSASSDGNRRHPGVSVTRLFIERCLQEARVISLSEFFALQPAVVSFPIQGAEKVFVGITGLAEGVTRTQVEIALKAAGIETTSTLKRGYHTHLLVGEEAANSSSSQMKIARAKEWGIHCVGLEFIDKIFRLGIIEPAVRRIDRKKSLLQKERSSRAESMGVATLGQTQSADLENSFVKDHILPLGIIEQATNLPLNMSRPWQRSASSSQALLNGEVSRGAPLSSYARLHNVDSLEAGSQAIKTSAEEVMALLSNRTSVDTSFDSTTSASSNARKRGRLPPSRLRERRAGSTASTTRQERPLSEIPSAEELLAMRKEEEDRIQANNSTQAAAMSTQDEQSMRVTYDDPISRRERRKLGDLIATSVKDKAHQEEAAESSGTALEVDDDHSAMIRTSSSSSISPSKRQSFTTKSSFSPSIKARRQPGTCLRD